ncbi:hypothetical protein AgCh_034860 [Apium graveolens]
MTMVRSTTREKCENSFQELKQRLVMAPMLALPDGKGDFVKCSDASHKGLGCVLMQHGKKELNICQRRQLELIKNNDWEILYHSGKANVVVDALSKKERLKMIMSLGEFIRDFGNSSEEKDDKGIMRYSYRIWVPKVQERKDENLDESHSLRNKI